MTDPKSSSKENTPETEKSKYSKSKTFWEAHLSGSFFVMLTISTLLFLFFKGSIDHYIDKVIVDIIFIHFENGGLQDVVWCVLSIIALFSVVKIKHWAAPGRTSLKSAIILIIASLIYWIIYRNDSIWIITSLEYCASIKYLDILIWFTICNAISWFIHYLSLPSVEGKGTGFSQDKEIQKLDEDALGYKDYAGTVADMIKKTFPTHSFTVGINGEWGSGKTSFMKLMLKHLEKEKSIIPIDFNPWASANAEAIIPDFFESLEHELSDRDHSLTRQLSHYANKLADFDQGIFQKIINLLPGFEQKTTAQYKSEIGQTLKLSGKRLLIIIDDLDRLDAEELMQVFKLIRNSVDFNNIIFVLAYNRAYVETTLSTQSGHNDKLFLEKMVQAEVNLPMILNDAIENKLVSEISDIIDQSAKRIEISDAEIDKMKTEVHVEVKYQHYQNDHTRNFIYNMRDANRLINSLKLCIPALIGEVHLPDLIRLEMLKLKFPDVYREIQDRWFDVLCTNEQTNFKRYFVQKNEWLLNDQKNTGTVANPKNDERTVIIELLVHLFPQHHANNNSKSSLVVQRVDKFHLYFRYHLGKSDFSYLNYLIARSSGIESFKKLIDTTLAERKGKKLQTRLESEDTSELGSKIEFETLLQGIFHIGNTITKSDSNHYSFEFEGLLLTKIIHSCLDFSNSISKQYYEGNKSQLKEFIFKKIFNFENADQFQNEIVMKCKLNLESYNKLSFETLFTFEELQLLNEEYLNNLLRNSTSYNIIILNALRACNNGKYFENETTKIKNQFPKDSVEKVQEFALAKSTSDFYLSFIHFQSEVSDYIPIQYAQSDMMFIFFDDLNTFRTELNQIDTSKWEFIEKYKSFVNKHFKVEGLPPEYSYYPFSPKFKLEIDEFRKRFYKLD